MEYEGINFNLDAIIQFQMLKQFLELLSKKQIDHNKLLYGNNRNTMKYNNLININKNIKINNKNKSKFSNTDNEKDIDNEDKILIDKINNYGLINEFIETQKQLIEYKNIINNLISRIEAIEENIDNKDNNIFSDENKNNNIMDKKHSNNDINKEIANYKVINENSKDDLNKSEINNNNYPKDGNKININNKDFGKSVLENKEIEKFVLSEKNLMKMQILNFEENIKKFKEQIGKIQNDSENTKKIAELTKNALFQFKTLIQEDINNLKLQQEKNMQEENKEKDVEKNNIEILEKKILKIIESKYKEFANKKIDNNMLKEIMKEKIKDENEILINDINNIKNNIFEIEKKINKLPNNSVILKLEEKIKLLSLEMEEYSTKKELQYVMKIIDRYENEIMKLKSFTIKQNESNAKNREDILKINNSFDNIRKTFLSICKLFENNSISQIVENLNDLSERMVEKEEYNKFCKEINKAFMDLKIDVNDHNRNLDQIMPLFNKILTLDDLNKLENSLTELIEKKKNDAWGKFANKKEIIKSIQSIESKVKLFMKNLNEEREKEKNENGAILASKPFGGYKCASCEAYLGELKNSYTYLPWNKIHGEEKSYRKGNSLSRILQGLNIENTYNPFIDNKNFIKAEKRNRNNRNINSTNYCLSVKNIKKLHPLLHVVSENNMVKNQIIEENLGLENTNENKKFQNRINLIRIKSFKGFRKGSEENLLNKSKDKDKNNDKSFNKKKKDNENNFSKKVIKTKINNIRENFENHYYIPNI